MNRESKHTPAYLKLFEQKGVIQIEDDVLYFCDPASKKKMQAGKVPQFLREDEVFQKGVDVLKGKNIRIAFNYHRGEIDIGPLQKQASWLENCALVGLEWNSALGYAMPQNRDEIRFIKISDNDQGLGRYIASTIQWLEKQGVPLVPCDIDTPTTPDSAQDTLRSYLADILSLAGSADQKMSGNRRDEITAEEWEQYHLAWSIYQHIRQYLILAQLGHMVAQFENLEPNDVIGLVIGTGHVYGVPQKAQQLGITVDWDVIHPLEGGALSEEINKKAMPNGQVSREGLSKVAEHELAA